MCTAVKHLVFYLHPILNRLISISATDKQITLGRQADVAMKTINLESDRPAFGV